MADDSLHYTPLPEQLTAKNDGSSSVIKSKLPLIIIGFLVVVALVLGVFYYLNVLSVQTKPAMQKPSITPTTASGEVNIFSDMEEQSLSCLDWAKYKARLDMIGQVCTPGCCPWVIDEDPGLGCRAPSDGECKPKGNPCSDGTCWECRFEDSRGFQLLRFEGNQWVSCSEEPTAAPTKNPIDVCTSPNECLKPEECAAPPAVANPGNQCANGLYCCVRKNKITPTTTPPAPPSPTIEACVKPTLNIEVECLQCDGEASTQ